MGLFNLVEQDHAVRPAADLFRQLPRLVIAHIARRGADELGDAVLFHIFAHVQPDERVLRVKQVGGQLFHQLRLAHAGGAHEDEGDGLVFLADACPLPADGGSHGIHGLVLPDDPALEPVGQRVQPEEILLTHLAGGDLGPKLDDPGQIVQRHLRRRLPPKLIQLLLQLQHPGAVLGDLFKILLLGAFQLHLLIGQPVQLILQGRDPAQGGGTQVHIGAGLIQQVDGLIRHEPVGDIPVGQIDRLNDDLIGDEHAVEGLIIALDAPEDVLRLRQRGLVDDHRLEAALQRGVLFDIFAVFLQGGGADDLDLAPAQGGLQDVGGVHAALCVACAHQIVDLVDDQNNIAQRLDLLDQALHAALKLAAELGPRHHGGHIQQPNLLVLQLVGHIACGDLLGQTLGNGRLAHARLADETGVVFLPAVQDLDDPQRLALPAHHPVQLAVFGLGGEILGIKAEEFLLFRLLFRAFALLAGLAGGLRLVLPEEFEQREGRRAGGSVFAVGVVLAAVLRILGHAQLLQHTGQTVAQRLRGQTVQILVLQAEFFQQVIDRLDAELLGALQAEPLVDGLSVFHFCDEDHCHILLAAGTDGHIHIVPP